MKRLTTLPAAFLFSSLLLGISTAADETYQLAKKNHAPPSGTVETSDTTTTLKDAAVDIDAGGQQIAGKVNRVQTTQDSIEVISPTKIRGNISQNEDENKITINGQDKKNPAPPEPLLNVPFILELKDGKWSGTLEKGEPTEEQKKALKKREDAANHDSDFQMYGDTPRKVGDEWKVDPGKIGIGQGGDFKGDYTVKFVEVKEIDGVKCAVLKATYDFKGEMDEDGKPTQMAMKGEAVSIRSIADMVDLDVHMNAEMTVDLSPTEGVSVHIVGPMEMIKKTTLKKP